MTCYLCKQQSPWEFMEYGLIWCSTSCIKKWEESPEGQEELARWAALAEKYDDTE